MEDKLLSYVPDVCLNMLFDIGAKKKTAVLHQYWAVDCSLCWGWKTKCVTEPPVAFRVVRSPLSLGHYQISCMATERAGCNKLVLLWFRVKSMLFSVNVGYRAIIAPCQPWTSHIYISLGWQIFVIVTVIVVVVVIVLTKDPGIVQLCTHLIFWIIGRSMHNLATPCIFGFLHAIHLFKQLLANFHLFLLAFHAKLNVSSLLT